MHDDDEAGESNAVGVGGCRKPLRWRLMVYVGLLVAAVGLLASCSRLSPDQQASRDLASTVSIAGLRKVAERAEGDRTNWATQLYFVGPADIDLAQAVSARDWSPEPAPAQSSAVIYHWILISNADDGDRSCDVMVSTLRPEMASIADGLTEDEKREVAAGTLQYVKVSCVCGG